MLPYPAMIGNHSRLHAGALWTAAIAVCACTSPARAQEDSLETPHATLRGWEESMRLAIFDRGGSFYGRTSDRGILQRFNTKQDSEYDLDVVSFSFPLTEEYDWYRRSAGARFAAGSIDHLRLIQQAEAKGQIALGASWGADVHLTQEETLRTQRSLARLRLRHELSGGRGQVFMLGTLRHEKPETDIEAGITWASTRGELTVAAGALDLFNDVVYQALGVAAELADTALDYRSHPFTGRLTLDATLGRKVRFEIHALAMTPSRIVAESQTREGEGFIQDERFGYVGGLIEWVPGRRTALGALTTWVRARLDRAPLANERPEDAVDVTEITRQLGAYAIHHFPRALTLEAWLLRVWRQEDRVRPDQATAPTIRYNDQAWRGRANVAYRDRSGFRADLGFDVAALAVVGPDRQLPDVAFLEDNHFRLRFDLGWEFGRRALVMVGTNADLDQDQGGAIGWFDGAHGRFSLYW